MSVFAVALFIRLFHIQQPLLENFIDRQVHTAMMARNLARGGSLLTPQIDIGPFPAYYMLEFPGYPWLVSVSSRLAGMPLDVTGRLLSSLALALACLGLFDLVRRHDNLTAGLLAGLLLATMPVAVRFGRAFQPDATMLGMLVLAVWAMDRWVERGRSRDLVLASLAAAGALLLKVIAGYMLLVLAYLVYVRLGRSMLRRWDVWAALAVAVAPAAAWYIHAWNLATTSETVSTPFWQWHKWIAPDRLLNAATYRQLAYFVGLRVLTPVGVLLAVGGALLRVRGQASGADRAGDGSFAPGSLLFHVWLCSLASYLPILIRKLDHEHYYLALAPVAAAFMARALCALAASPLAERCYVSGRTAAGMLLLLLLVLNAAACSSTFRVPGEWVQVPVAAAATRELTPPGALVAGHSSVLFYADRRGFTFAYGPDEIEYLFGTWGRQPAQPIPAELLEFYRMQGAEFFVELLGTNRERQNPDFFRYVREHYPIVRESPGEYMIVSLNRPDFVH